MLDNLIEVLNSHRGLKYLGIWMPAIMYLDDDRFLKSMLNLREVEVIKILSTSSINHKENDLFIDKLVAVI